MGFEVYVAWSEHGEPCTVAFAQLEALFAGAIRSRSTSDHGTAWTLDYEGARCEALVQGHGSTVSCVSIDRPVAAVELWETLIQAMRLGHGVCFWPGNAYAIATEEDRAHLPLDMLGDGDPAVVTSGLDLRAVVEAS